MIDPFNIPPDIIQAANRVSTYMKVKGYRNWELCGLCDRSFANASHIVEMMELLDGAYDIVELWKPEFPTQVEWKTNWLKNAQACGATSSP